jgi:glycosyltransferase involved in cell wall biosynthesis
MSEKVISFIQPSRNNLKYLKWSYNSIRKNLGYRHEICWADDFSDDGTWEWMQEIAEKDGNIKIHRNEGPKRLGHTILYDKLVDMASNDIVMIYHADMYACPGLDEEVLKHLERGKVVSATRISLHLGRYTKKTSNLSVDTTRCMPHNQKKTRIYSIDFNWLDTKRYRPGKDSYII